jgi:Spy/CpxP family protein refolding chaperone
MKQTSIALLATLPVLIGISSLAAVAQVGGTNEGSVDRRVRFEERRERILEQLDLTEAQQADIQAIRDQARAEHDGLRQQLERERATMRSLMEGNATADQIRQQHDLIQQLHQQLGDAMLDTRLEIREVLTEEQRAQFVERMPGRLFDGGGWHREGGRSPRSLGTDGN